MFALLCENDLTFSLKHCRPKHTIVGSRRTRFEQILMESLENQFRLVERKRRPTGRRVRGQPTTVGDDNQPDAAQKMVSLTELIKRHKSRAKVASAYLEDAQRTANRSITRSMTTKNTDLESRIVKPAETEKPLVNKRKRKQTSSGKGSQKGKSKGPVTKRGRKQNLKSK